MSLNSTSQETEDIRFENISLEDSEMEEDSENKIQEDFKEAHPGQKYLIYCRISSKNQKQGTSLQVQEQECLNHYDIHFKKENDQILIVHEIASASNINESKSKNRKLYHLITNPNNNGMIVIVHHMSRFSRNLQEAIELWNYMNNHKIRLISIHDQFDSINGMSWFLYSSLINAAVLESKMISDRVKKAIEYKKSLGHEMGNPKYGEQIKFIQGIRKKTVKENEKIIINFIKHCKKRGTHLDYLNMLLQKICYEYDLAYVPIKLSKSNYIEDGLSYENIASLLNSYEITYKSRPWTKQNVAYVLKHC